MEGCRILLVDDEPRMLESLLYALQEESTDHQIDTAVGGQEALKKLSQGAYDLVVTDLMMPEVNGYDVMDYIAEHTPETSVVVITAYSSLESATEAMRRGASDYLVKPFDLDAFVLTVRREIERCLLRRAVRRQADEVRILGEVAQLINAHLEIGPVFDRLIGSVQSLIDVAWAEIALVRSGRFSEVEGVYPSEAPLCDDREPWERALSCRSQVLVERRSGSERIWEWMEQQGLSCLLITPLLTQERPLGTFTVGRREGIYRLEDRQLLQRVADQIASGVEKALLFRQTQAQLERLRQAQSQLVQSARLSAVAALADGVAHEINNPLSVIIANVQLLRRFPGLTPEAREDLDRVYENAQRIAHIVRSFTDFAHPIRGKDSQQPVDVNRIIQGALLLLGARMGRRQIGIRRKLAPKLPLVLANAQQLRQVFVNVLINAMEAIERSKTVPPGGHWIEISSYEEMDGEQRYVAVRICDTGVGIPPEYLDRIFEPGFTTKIENGAVRGLGLGLFAAYTVVKAHKGEIQVESRVGEGACFTVRLPATDEVPMVVL